MGNSRSAMPSKLGFTEQLQKKNHDKGERIETLKRLVEIRGGINSVDSKGTSALHIAAETGNFEFLKYLIQRGADLNCKDVSYLTPLHLACAHGHMECATALIKAKALKDQRDIWGWTPLHRAVINKHFNVPEMLIMSGCSVNSQDQSKRVPLHVAASYGQRELTQILVQNGANLDWQDKRGRTPLYLAVVGQHVELVKDLISYGCNINVLTPDRLSPLALAVSKGYQECVSVLLRSGARYINSSPFKSDVIPLESALLRAQNTENKKFKQYVEIVKMLIQANSQPPSPQCFFLVYRILQLRLQEDILFITHMLFAAGMKPGAPALNVTSMADEILYQWLKKYVHGTLSLQELCRVKIRQQLQTNFSKGTSMYNAVDQLHIPTRIKDFLLLVYL